MATLKHIVVLMFAVMMSGCSTGTSVVINRSFNDVATTLLGKFGAHKGDSGLSNNVVTQLRGEYKPDATHGYVPDSPWKYRWYESPGDKYEAKLLPADWRTQITLTAEEHTAKSTRITVYAEQGYPGFMLMTQKARREDIEGLRIAQLLRMLVPEDPSESKN